MGRIPQAHEVDEKFWEDPVFAAKVRALADLLRDARAHHASFALAQACFSKGEALALEGFYNLASGWYAASLDHMWDFEQHARIQAISTDTLAYEDVHDRLEHSRDYLRGLIPSEHVLHHPVIAASKEGLINRGAAFTPQPSDAPVAAYLFSLKIRIYMRACEGLIEDPNLVLQICRASVRALSCVSGVAKKTANVLRLLALLSVRAGRFQPASATPGVGSARSDGKPKNLRVEDPESLSAIAREIAEEVASFEFTMERLPAPAAANGSSASLSNTAINASDERSLIDKNLLQTISVWYTTL
jgi:hypothetical protein